MVRNGLKVKWIALYMGVNLISVESTLDTGSEFKKNI